MKFPHRIMDQEYERKNECKTKKEVPPDQFSMTIFLRRFRESYRKAIDCKEKKYRDENESSERPAGKLRNSHIIGKAIVKPIPVKTQQVPNFVISQQESWMISEITFIKGRH